MHLISCFHSLINDNLLANTYHFRIQLSFDGGRRDPTQTDRSSFSSEISRAFSMADDADDDLQFYSDLYRQVAPWKGYKNFNTMDVFFHIKNSITVLYYHAQHMPWIINIILSFCSSNTFAILSLVWLCQNFDQKNIADEFCPHRAWIYKIFPIIWARSPPKCLHTVRKPFLQMLPPISPSGTCAYIHSLIHTYIHTYIRVWLYFLSVRVIRFFKNLHFHRSMREEDLQDQEFFEEACDEMLGVHDRSGGDMGDVANLNIVDLKKPLVDNSERGSL